MSYNAQTLWNSTLAHSRDRRSYEHPEKIEFSQAIPYAGTNMILYICHVSTEKRVKKGLTSQLQKNRYGIQIAFGGVKITNEKPRYDNFPLEYNKETYYVQVPRRNKNKIMIRCTCPDFYFTWSYYNWRKSCLYGNKPKPYIRKTTTYPERNPKHLVGGCKHVWMVLDVLRQERRII